MQVDRDIRLPLYIQVYESLLEGIRERRYPACAFLPSERELSKAYAVDRLTVRRALQLLVNEGLVDKQPGLGTRVRDLPSRDIDGPAARNLVFLLPRSTHSFERITEPCISELFYRVEKESRRHRYHLFYTTVSEDDSTSVLLRESRVAGVFFVSRIPERFIQEARRLGLPAVVVNHESSLYPAVLPDREEGVHEAVSYLVRLEHRRIAFISGLPGYVSTGACIDGYRRALDEAGLDWRNQLHGEGDWTFDGGYRAFTEMLQQCDDLPSAVFASNDMTALGALEAARVVGLSVPGDLSLVGVDDIAQCLHSSPRLTTVRVDNEAIARAACGCLFQAIERGEAQNVKIIVPTRLVVRESTASPARAAVLQKGG